MRFVHFAFAKIRHAERRMGHREIWIQFQCLFQIGVSVLAMAVEQQIAEIGLRLGFG